jgi:hypothetical protein
VDHRCPFGSEPHRIDIMADESHDPAFLALNPNGKIPAIYDPDGPSGTPFALFESGAILLYLADKTGQFISADPNTRYETIQWVMWQMGGVGPMFGQVGFLPARPLPWLLVLACIGEPIAMPAQKIAFRQVQLGYTPPALTAVPKTKADEIGATATEPARYPDNWDNLPHVLPFPIADGEAIGKMQPLSLGVIRPPFGRFQFGAGSDHRHGFSDEGSNSRTREKIKQKSRVSPKADVTTQTPKIME